MTTTKDLKAEVERLAAVVKSAEMELAEVSEEARSVMARLQAAELEAFRAKAAAREADWKWKRSLPLTSLQRMILEKAQNNTVGRSDTAVELERLRYLRVERLLSGSYYHITPEGRAKLAEHEVES